MYAARISCRNPRWSNVVQQGEKMIRSNCKVYSIALCSNRAPIRRNYSSQGSLIARYLSDYYLSSNERRFTRLHGRPDISWRSCRLRLYSSEGDGRNASEDKHTPAKDVKDSGEGKMAKENVTGSIRHCDAHARLGEQDQKEWLHNEKQAIENKKKESPFLTRRERFKNEFLRRIVPWEKIAVSWDTFPYHIHEHSKNLLVECAASHLKHNKFNTTYGGRLTSSSMRILLRSIPGTQLYRERLVRALAKDLQVPLLKLDSSVLAPYAFSEDYSSESESDEDNAESGEEGTSESEAEDENDASNEESEARTDASDDEIDIQASAEALKKLIPYNLEDFEKSVRGDSDGSSQSSKSETVKPSDKANRPLKYGDRVKYTGPSVEVEADKRTLPSGQQGEVYEVNGDQIAVIFDLSGKASIEDKILDPAARPSIYWISVKDIEHDVDAQTHDCYDAMEALCEVLQSRQPLIVYFPDLSLWVSRAIPKSNRKEFINKVKEMFDQLSGPVVLICGQAVSGSKEKEKFTMILPNLGRLAKLPLSLNRFIATVTAQHSFKSHRKLVNPKLHLTAKAIPQPYSGRKMMAGALNCTPTPIFRPLSTRKFPSKRVFFVQSSTNSSETPVASTSVSIKEEPGSGFPVSPPPNFKPPKPKPFSVRPDKVFDILGASLALVFRLTTSVLVSGYSASLVPKNEIPSEDYALEFAGYKLKETSKLGPRPEKPIEIYEFESCPFCRKVREIVAVLDLDVLFYPCPRNGPNFRPKAVQMGGKKQFPYMVDPNTGVSMYESDDIIKYLVEKYGDGKVPILLSLGLLTTLTEGFAMIGRMGRGSSYTPSKLPAKPLEIWAYEASPFCKVVREVLVELELPHLLHSCARGSPKRHILKQRVGHFQVPYLEDPNSGVQMFESAEIIEYLRATYAL